MPDARLIAALDPFELWKILAPLKPNAYEFVPGKQKFGVREKGRHMVRYFRTVDELEDFVRTAQKIRPGPRRHRHPLRTRSRRRGRLRTATSARSWLRRGNWLPRGSRYAAWRRSTPSSGRRARRSSPTGTIGSKRRRSWKRSSRARARPLAPPRRNGVSATRRSRTSPTRRSRKPRSPSRSCATRTIRGARGIDASIRADIFKEFWEQLEKIERER